MLASKEPVANARRQAARSRVDQLKGDIQHLGAALQSLATRREARRREVEERELLLTTEFTTNAASRESETSIMIDRALEHQAALGRTNRWSPFSLLATKNTNTDQSPFHNIFLCRYMDDVLGQGAEILQSLQVFSLFNNRKFDWFESKVKHVDASRTREMYSRVPRENCWMWQIV